MPTRTFKKRWSYLGTGRPRADMQNFRGGIETVVSDEVAAFADQHGLCAAPENKSLGDASANKAVAPGTAAEPVKRGRGRPRKTPVAAEG